MSSSLSATSSARRNWKNFCSADFFATHAKARGGETGRAKLRHHPILKMKKIAFAVKLAVCLVAVGLLPRAGRAAALELDFAPSPATGELILTAGKTAASIFVETNNDRAVLRAAGDLAEDFARVTGQKPAVENDFSGGEKNCVILGTLGLGGIVDRLVAEKKLDAAGMDSGWESYILQVVKDPLPGVEQALVIAGSDRRGTIFGIRSEERR